MLKLVVNNISSLYNNPLSQGSETKPTPIISQPQNKFLVDIQAFSQNLYILRAQDFEHELKCEMTLELKENFNLLDGVLEEEKKYLVPILTFNFPSIDVRRFNEKVCWDVYLQVILITQFQLKILKHLFIFCEKKDVVNLILTIDEADLDYLEIYRSFSISEEKIITARGEKTKVVIQTDVQTYDEVIDFMDEVEEDLYKTLWRDQKVNPAFRKYLIDHALFGH
jgi:hypothetical protein